MPLLVVALLAAGCAPATMAGQDRTPSTQAPQATNSPATASPAGATRPAATADPGAVEVLMGDHFFDPQFVVVKVGTTVTWRNSSGYHDVTSRDGLFRSPTLGESFSHTFTEPGRYPFFCSFHTAEMRGVIIVEPAN